MRSASPRLALTFALASCASSAPQSPSVHPAPPPATTPNNPPTPPPPSSDASATPEATADVASLPTSPPTTDGGEDLTIHVGGGSDLPPGPPDTMLTTMQAIERAMEPVRPQLRVCLRSLVPRVPRRVRVLVLPDGSVRQRPPQEYAFSPRVGSCVDGALRALEVTSPPPREVPYDIAVDPPAGR